ncbi:MAG: DNA adenine methylase [Edaphocola sp.]
MKNYNQAPLPFQGQKRRFLGKFKEALKGFPGNATYVDLFGGSGLLAHTVKQTYPQADVVWNDFDNYQERIDHIADTNNILADLRPLLAAEPRDKKVRQEVREKVLRLVEKAGYVDYVTLSANILFSGKYVDDLPTLRKETFYNCLRQGEYGAEGYLQGVQRVRADYKDIFRQYANRAGVVFLVDPPYLSTDTQSYKGGSCWRLADYFDVLHVLDNCSYFYFTSNKSQIVELCQWLETRTSNVNPFKYATVGTTAGNVNFNSAYTDIMLFKKKKR